MRLSNHYFGLLAEYIICFLYICKFHQILHHRYNNKLGEIDIIARKGKKLIFIEVKARKYGICEDIVSVTQKQRITRSAEFFLLKNRKYSNYDVRFDLAVVQPYRWPLIINNAW